MDSGTGAAVPDVDPAAPGVPGAAISPSVPGVPGVPVPAVAVPGARRPSAGEDGGARFLEMRVHGVSNTPPADLLGMPKVRPADDVPVVVAGDARTGFYRAPSPDARDAGVTVEVYSWGQLTSGMRAVKDIQRALWTLLLPFMLGNLAFHARPDIPADPKDETPLSRAGVSAFLVRLLCLSLTVFVVLGTAGVGVDLFAWQCVDQECLGQIPGPWEFLDTGWWHIGGRALVVGLLAPFLILGVIGLLTWRSYHYEAVVPTRRPDPDAPGRRTRWPTRTTGAVRARCGGCPWCT